MTIPYFDSETTWEAVRTLLNQAMQEIYGTINTGNTTPPTGAPVITTAPLITLASPGVAPVYTDAVSTSTPTPTITYFLVKNGAIVAAGASAIADYTNITNGDSLVIRAIPSNAIGTGATVDSAAVVVEAVVAGMALGLNVTADTTYSGAWQFINLMHTAAEWQQFSGTGDFTQNQGVLNATVATDQFRVHLADLGTGLPHGTYTVLNPSAANIAVGSFGAINGSFSTATNWTFDYEGGGLYLFITGSLTQANGNLAIIMPGQFAAWQAGEVFNPDFLNWTNALGQEYVRLMDWAQAPGSLEQDWSDRTLPTGITFVNKYFMPVVPWEVQIALANKTNRHLWLCPSVRATDDYLTQLGNLVDANLKPGLKKRIEPGDELWNTKDPYVDGYSWVNYWGFTRRIAAANFAVQGYTLAGHGFTNGTQLTCFNSRENWAVYEYGTGLDWQTGLGQGVNVNVIDANTFQILRSDGSVIPVAAKQVNLLFVVNDEPGKYYSATENVGKLLLHWWDVLDPIFGAANYEHIVPSMWSQPGRTTASFGNAGVPARADSVCVAPYYSGMRWGGSLAVASGQVTPAVWSSDAACTITVNIYSGQVPQPTFDDAIAGVGAVSNQTIAYTGLPNDAGGNPVPNNDYLPCTAVTGLTDGNTYTAVLVYGGTEGHWMLSQTFVPSATAATVYVDDVQADFAARCKAALVPWISLIQQHATASGGKPIIAYEANLDFVGNGRPDHIVAWLENWLRTDFGADTIKNLLYTMSATGMSQLMFFSDVNDLSPDFKVSQTYLDTGTDNTIYTLFKSLQGSVPTRTQVSFDPMFADPVLSAPSSYPYTVEVLPSGYTYQILDGNLNGRYALQNGSLVMLNSTGVDFDAPATQALTVLADDGYTCSKFTLGVSTGNAWYEADATFAWSPTTDTTTATIDPVLGPQLTLKVGSAATVIAATAPNVGSLWQFDGTQFYDNAASPLPLLFDTTPFVMVDVIQGLAQSYLPVDGVGDGNNFGLVNYPGGGGVNWHVYNGTMNGGVPVVATPPAGAHAYWLYYDGAGTATVGYDQVTCTVQNIGAFGGWIHTIGVGGWGVTAGPAHDQGPVQLVIRAGLTLADAQLIVSKVQAYCGIS